jgi:predicted GNAT family N-acyltransferase
MKKFDLKIVSNADDHLKTVAVRAIVYVAEQKCPWDEEFDGNDYTATQILGLVGDEPVATARIRWFTGFAKLERLAIRREFRGYGYGHMLLQFMIELCQRKGSCSIYLHAQSQLRFFYEAYGFHAIREPFGFSDHSYFEMKADLQQAHNAYGLQHGPHVLNRPEGQWDRPGILEASSVRMQGTFSAPMQT